MASTIRRGDVWWLKLPTPHGSAPGNPHWGLVVQSEAFLASELRTVTLLVLTSNLKVANRPGNTVLSPEHTGLPMASVVNVSQVVTADRSVLGTLAGRVPRRVMEDVDAGILKALGLEDPWLHDREPESAEDAVVRRALSVLERLEETMTAADGPGAWIRQVQDARSALARCLPARPVQ